MTTTYDPTKHYGESVWTPCSTTSVTSFPFTVPTDPCELIITHASKAGTAPGPDLTAHFSVTKGDLGVINPQKVGNSEAILCYGKNVQGKGAVTAAYIVPGAACFLNVGVSPHNTRPVTASTASFGLLCNRAPL